jgi:hypothetical protein
MVASDKHKAGVQMIHVVYHIFYEFVITLNNQAEALWFSQSTCFAPVAGRGLFILLHHRHFFHQGIIKEPQL